jgi:type I restriction enzyme M protein
LIPWEKGTPHREAIGRKAKASNPQQSPQTAPKPLRALRLDDPNAYHSEGVVFLTQTARFDYLLALPEGEAVGKSLSDAMRDVEKNNPSLSGVLPKTYEIFNGTLLKELLKKVSEISATLSYDAFGRIYEYFLGEFARTEGQKGGEFFTPSSIVRLLVEILEPFHGRILDPACGSGGMFVQSARFVAEHKRNGSSGEGTRAAATDISIYGQEPCRKCEENHHRPGRGCRLTGSA